MLRFFRTIRKKLIEEDNVRKPASPAGRYLLYAIGEILLVVIGILIALQVNNWNESRKAAKDEQFLLSSLLQDFELRQAELLEFNEAREQTLSAIHELYTIINNPEMIPDPQVMDTLLAKAGNALSFNDQFRTLDMLFTSGKINDLKNDQLKKDLIEWPQKVEEMMEEQRFRAALRSNVLLDLMMEYVAIRRIAESFEFREYGLRRDQPVTFESDYIGLIQDPAYERYLAYTEQMLHVNQIDSEVLITLAEKIIATLKMETAD